MDDVCQVSDQRETNTSELCGRTSIYFRTISLFLVAISESTVFVCVDLMSVKKRVESSFCFLWVRLPQFFLLSTIFYFLPVFLVTDDT